MTIDDCMAKGCQMSALVAEIERLTRESVSASYHLYEVTKLEAKIERLTAALAGIACWSIDHNDAKARANRALEDKP